MDKFLLATNPMRPPRKFENQEVFIIHAIHPLAVIRCELDSEMALSGSRQELRKTVSIPATATQPSKFEEWTLEAIQFDDSVDVEQLLRRAWRWFYSYRQQFPFTYTIDHAND